MGSASHRAIYARASGKVAGVAVASNIASRLATVAWYARAQLGGASASPHAANANSGTVTPQGCLLAVP